MQWIKVEPRYYQAQGPPLSAKVSFVKIDPGDWKLPQDNQRVSGSVFQRSPIIIVARLFVFGRKFAKALSFSLEFSTIDCFPTVQKMLV